MFKKVLGITSILLGLFLSISSLSQGFLMLRSLSDVAQQNSAYNTGFVVGQCIALIVFLVVAFFLIKYGLKWLKVKK